MAVEDGCFGYSKVRKRLVSGDGIGFYVGGAGHGSSAREGHVDAVNSKYNTFARGGRMEI